MRLTKQRREEIATMLPTGRGNALSIAEIVAIVPGTPARSTVRLDIVRLQEAGTAILSSPRAGVWLAANEDERLDVIEELRAQINALERRMSLINGGRCALRSCRIPLSEKTKRRGGLYCCPDHRYLAAADRDKRAAAS